MKICLVGVTFKHLYSLFSRNDMNCKEFILIADLNHKNFFVLAYMILSFTYKTALMKIHILEFFYKVPN